MDILIYAKPEKVEHKMKNNVNKDVMYCYWTVSVHPNLKTKVVNKVYFSDGNHIYAQGNFVGIDYEKDGIKKAIYFNPLEQVNLKQPRKPPTRGWCYINQEGK